MVSVTTGEAIRRLKAVGARLNFTDTGIEAISGKGGEFKLHTVLNYTDRLGSLVPANDVAYAEHIHFHKNRSK